jgi:hypothetical protein
MTNFNSQSTDINWVEDVYQLLMDIARSSLSDIPRLPDNFSQKALPLLQKVQSIEDGQDGQASSGTSGYEREWAQQVRQFLLEITSVYLSEQPRMPENLAGRAITLAEKAQAIKESADENEPPSVNESDSSVPHPDVLLQLLRESFKIQRSKSHNPDAPQWQQAITMLDVVQGMYTQVRE